MNCNCGNPNCDSIMEEAKALLEMFLASCDKLADGKGDIEIESILRAAVMLIAYNADMSSDSEAELVNARRHIMATVLKVVVLNGRSFADISADKARQANNANPAFN